MDLELSRVLPSGVTDKLSDSGINHCKDFLSRHPVELMKYLSIPYLAVNKYIADVSRIVAPKSQTAFEMYHATCSHFRRVFPTHLQKLDTLLQGGIPVGCITEIAGPPAIGKTQLCLQLSVAATSHGSVVYIDTEGAFSAQRLMEIATTRFNSRFKDSTSLLHMASNIHVYTEMTCNDLMKRLDKLRQLVDTHSSKLVVVDSIASLVRKEFDVRQKDGNARRAALLCKQATILKSIAECYGIPIVVTNQITGIVSHEDSDVNEFDYSDCEKEFMITTALGNTWSHCVNTRLLLTPGNEGCHHVITVAKSPLAPFYQMAYNIDAKGLVMDWAGSTELASHTARQEQMIML